MSRRIALLGLEFWPHAKFLAEALRNNPQFTIVGGYCQDSRLRSWFESEYGVRVEKEIERALDTKPDIAFISGKIVDSHKYAIKALEFGCHVMTTRPVAFNSAAAEQLLSAQSKNPGHKVTTQYYTRFWPEIRHMLESVAAGKIGKPVWGSLVTHRAGPVQELPDGGPPGWWMNPKENVGGGFAAHVIYCLNVAHKIFGEPDWDVEPMVTLTKIGGAPVEDLGFATVQYGAATVSFDGSWRAAANTGGWAFNILGTRGEISVDYRRRPTMYQITDGERTEISFPPLDRDQIWREMLQSFSEAIDGKREVEVSLAEAVLDVRLLDAFYKRPRIIQRDPLR